MIVLTGATGHLGSATIDFLLKKGALPTSLTAFVRDLTKAESIQEKGVTIQVGSYDDYDSMVAAFQNADKLLLISGTDIANRIHQQATAVKAAQEAGVKHIVYTSFMRKNETGSSPIEMIGQSHRETERLIKASGIRYTILKNSVYTEVLLMFLGEKVLESGIFYPAGQGRANYTTRLDMAEATATILMESGHENKEYTLASTQKHDMNEVAAFLSEITGHPVPYLNPGKEVYRDALTRASVPDEYIGMFVGFAEAIQQGEFDTDTSDLETLLGRKATSLRAYLQSVYSPIPTLQS